MNQNAPCKLCGLTAKLHKKSHIIPDFMYQGIFDDKHRMIQTSVNNISKKTIAQSGIHEKYILCSKCEILFSKLERYASLLLYAENAQLKNPPLIENRQSKDGIKSLFITNIDYSKLKLCILSIVWKAHISSNTFFKNVNISESEPLIRKMLLENDCKTDDDFRISIIGILDKHDKLARLVTEPFVSTLGNGKFVRFFINGFFYFIDLKPNSNFSTFKEHYLKENGELEIALLKGQLAQSLLEAIGMPSSFVNLIT